MAFTHIVTFVFRPGSEAPATASAALTEFAATVPQVREYRCAPDAGISEGNADMALVARFDSEDDFAIYRDHPEHQRIIAELIAPDLVERTAVQLRA